MHIVRGSPVLSPAETELMSQSLTETPSLTPEDPCKSSVLAGRKIRQQIQKRGEYKGEMCGNEQNSSGV